MNDPMQIFGTVKGNKEYEDIEREIDDKENSMTLTELIGEIDKVSIAIDNLRFDPLSPIEAVKLVIEYRKMLALESISLALSHSDIDLTNKMETMRGE